MNTYVALLRAVNVGGTGKMPMTDLCALCEKAGFANPRTYIASGNVIFESAASEKSVQSKLEKALATYAGKPVGVMVRTPDELARILAANPFADGAPNFTVTIFLNEPPAKDALSDVRGQKNERVALGRREIYVDYGGSMGRTKLVIPAAKTGTARNMNTVAKLLEMARASGGKQGG